MERKEINEAVSALENSIKILETPKANYKLGLIYLQIDKIKAEKYIHKAFLKEPFLVNPYIYNSLLDDLMDASLKADNAGSYNLYKIRSTRFKNKIKEIYLYKNDILIENVMITKYKNKHYLVFDIENSSKNDIPQLFMEIEFYVNSNKYIIKQKPVSQTNPLSFNNKIEQYKIALADNIKFNDIEKSNDVIIKFYAKKRPLAPFTLVKIDSFDF